MLFFGPSGCGKTHFANAITGENHKVDPTWSCVRWDSSKILSGNASEIVEQGFKAIERFGIKQIIIDDLEVVINDLKTDPKAFRLYLFNLRKLRNVLVIATTKRPNQLGLEILDIFDEFLPFLYPLEEDRLDILRLYFSQFKPLDTENNILLHQLSNRTEWFTCLELAKLIIDSPKQSPVVAKDFLVTLDQLASGFNIESRREELKEYLDFTLRNSKVPFEFQEHAKRVWIELTPEANTGLLKPDDPFKNIIKVQRMISSCEEYLNWIDKWFSSYGLTLLSDAVESMAPRIREIRILTRAEQVDGKFRRLFKDFSKSTKKRGITAELRVIGDAKLEANIHDRWILSKIKNFNIPSPDTIARGQYAEIKSTNVKLPFDEWWNKSIDIITDWDRVMKLRKDRGLA